MGKELALETEKIRLANRVQGLTAKANTSSARKECESVVREEQSKHSQGFDPTQCWSESTSALFGRAFLLHLQDIIK